MYFQAEAAIFGFFGFLETSLLEYSDTSSNFEKFFSDKYEDIEQILAEADDLLQQIDPEIIEYLKEEQRAQLEQQVQSLKKLKFEVECEDKIGKEGPSKSKPYSEGMHEAIEDIAKAMKALASYLS